MMKTTTTSATSTAPRQARRARPPLAQADSLRARRRAALRLIVSALRAEADRRSNAGVVTRGPLTVTVLEEGKTRIRHRYIISPPVAGYLQSRAAARGRSHRSRQDRAGDASSRSPRAFSIPARAPRPRRGCKATEAAKMQRETQIERAQAALDLAQKELKRSRELRKSGAIRAKEWDAAENRVNMLTRELHTAEFALQVADFELAQAQAALMQARVAGDRNRPSRSRSSRR